MISSTAFAASVVVATVLGLQDGQAKLDKGLVDGLRKADVGRAYYTLTVESRRVRVDVGPAEIVECDDFASIVRSQGNRPLRPGYSVEIEVPPERVSATSLLEFGNARLQKQDYPAALSYFRKIQELLPGDALAARRIEEVQGLLEGKQFLDEERRRLDFYRLAAQGSLEEGDLRSARSYLEKILRVEPTDAAGLQMKAAIERLERAARMLRVPAGQYGIGLEPREARFYNQQPRIQASLQEFWIDRRPVTAGQWAASKGTAESGRKADEPIVNVTFEEASKYCRSLGKRLPNELEWEAASAMQGFQMSEGVSEWTASWYQPYPGNTKPEAEYGEKFRVVKGFGQDGVYDAQQRFFMSPAERARDVGFRCAAASSAVP